MKESPRLHVITVDSFSIFSPLSELIVRRCPGNMVAILMADAGYGALHGHVYGIVLVWVVIGVLHVHIIRIIFTSRDEGLDVPRLQTTLIA